MPPEKPTVRVPERLPLKLYVATRRLPIGCWHSDEPVPLEGVEIIFPPNPVRHSLWPIWGWTQTDGIRDEECPKCLSGTGCVQRVIYNEKTQAAEFVHEFPAYLGMKRN